ncbi:MAG: hypothetical protein COA45_12605 [Zetaproteobacteria bacterium]|nr:MAG: hypothetical protein COA45_12605 [Zetaproteobacteria bacterium]
MSTHTVEQAIEAIYEALQNDNEEIDARIKDLQVAMKEEGIKEAKFDASRLVQGNREGRKRMQSYFKRRGVKVVFK